MRWSHAAGALCLLLGAGCSGKVIPTGGLMIVMRQDGSLTPDELKVHITSVDKTHTYFNGDYSIPGRTTLPASVAIATNGDASASVLVDVSVWQKHQLLDERLEQVSHIPTNQLTELDVLFSSRCMVHVASPCSGTQTCDPATGNCVDNTVNASQLPPYTGDAGALATGDGGAPEDEGGDGAETDVASDTGSDAGDAASSPGDATTGTDAGGDATIGADAASDAPQDVVEAAPTPDGGDPEIDYGMAPVTLTMGAFQVQPGQEDFQCQTFADPWNVQVDVKEYTASVGTGTHSVFAFYAPATAPDGGTAIGACANGDLTWGPFTFFAETDGETLHYPPTVGATIPVNNGFQLVAHFFNPGSAALSPTVSVTMVVAKGGAVTQHAGVLFLNNKSINMIPPACVNAGCQSQGMYTLTQAMTVVSSNVLMSKYSRNFTASVPGKTFAQATNWAGPPPTIESPLLSLTSGTMVTWTCTDVSVSMSGPTLYYGSSLSQNVQCISISAIYPVADPTNPVVGGMTL